MVTAGVQFSSRQDTHSSPALQGAPPSVGSSDCTVAAEIAAAGQLSNGIPVGDMYAAEEESRVVELIEFVRVPDEGHYVAGGWLTKGQILSE